MPYKIKDFDTIVKKKMYLDLHPFGWVKDKNTDGVKVEFGWMMINNYDPEESLCMHVVGTDHYWAWFRTNFITLSQGNYYELFTKQLEEFRLDFLLWIKNPDTAGLDWVREYYEIFQGRFYDFSPSEQSEYDRARQEWERDQSEIEHATDEFIQKSEMFHRTN